MGYQLMSGGRGKCPFGSKRRIFERREQNRPEIRIYYQRPEHGRLIRTLAKRNKL